MNFLLLIPGLFTLLEKCLGPILTMTHKSSIITSIIGGFDGSSSGLMGIIEGAIGKIEDQKKLELQAEVETLLAQSKIEEIEAQSPHFLAWAARPCFEWIILLNIGFHYTLVSAIDTYNFFMGTTDTVHALDPMALAICLSLLGIYHAVIKK